MNKRAHSKVQASRQEDNKEHELELDNPFDPRQVDDAQQQHSEAGKAPHGPWWVP